jgi:hypothetical protein
MSSGHIWRWHGRGGVGGGHLLCWKSVAWTRKPVNSALSVPVKSTGVQFVLVLPPDEKSWKMPTYRVLDPGFTHACMRCNAGLDLRACSYELVSCLKGAASSQICQSGAAMPDRLAPLLATNHLVSATVNMFALQNRTHTSSPPPHTGVTEPYLIPLCDSLVVSKHPMILYVCWYFRW